MRDVILGRGQLGARLARLLDAPALGSDVDLTTSEGVEAVARMNPDRVWVAVRPPPATDPVLFYRRTSENLASLRCSVVLLSSSAVYGTNLAAHEAAILAPESVYGMGKLLEEHLILSAHPRALVVREFDVYGDTRGVVHAVRQKLSDGARLSLSDVRMDFVHADDCVSGLLALACSGYAGVVNLGTGRATTPKDIADAYVSGSGQGYSYDMVPPTRCSTVADVSRLADVVGVAVVDRWYSRFMEDIRGESRS